MFVTLASMVVWCCSARGVGEGVCSQCLSGVCVFVFVFIFYFAILIVSKTISC